MSQFLAWGGKMMLDCQMHLSLVNFKESYGKSKGKTLFSVPARNSNLNFCPAHWGKSHAILIRMKCNKNQ